MRFHLVAFVLLATVIFPISSRAQQVVGSDHAPPATNEASDTTELDSDSAPVELPTSQAQIPAGKTETATDFAFEPVPDVPTPATEGFAVEEVNASAEAPGEGLLDMSLDDLLSMKIETASKKEEEVFDSPLASSVITRDLLLRSGVKSIPEAIRLAAGMLVLEGSNGNYDVRVRGMSSVLPAQTPSNDTLLLVMIDNRIVYNYFNGGTMWETLPIGIVDIERIEIVRGPASALYGPNAVLGVVNIITRSFDDGVHVSGDFSAGDIQDGEVVNKHAELSLTYARPRYSITFSGNVAERMRTERGYFLWGNEDVGIGYADTPAEIVSAWTQKPYDNYRERYPEQRLGVRQIGLNTFGHFTPSDDIRLDLAGGYQNSRAQKIFVDNYRTPLTTFDSETYYAQGALKLWDVLGRIDYTGGDQEVLGIPEFEWKMKVLNTSLEYDFSWKSLAIRPGIGYHTATYEGGMLAQPARYEVDEPVFDDSGALLGYHLAGDPIVDEDGKIVTDVDDATISSFDGSLRVEYTFFERLRLIGAGRADKYEHSAKWHPSWQALSTLRLTDNQMIRIGYGRSNRAPFMVQTHLNYYANSEAVSHISTGNEDLDLMYVDSIEAGYRGRLADKLLVDLEGFYQQMSNWMVDWYLLQEREYVGGYLARTDVDGAIVDSRTGGKFLSKSQYRNMNIVSRQFGATVNLTLLLSEKATVTGYITWQRTLLDGFYEASWGTRYQFDNRQYLWAPACFGGAVVSLRPVQGLSVVLAPYFQTKHYQYSELIGEMAKGIEAEANVLLNAKIAYEFVEGATAYLNLRNLGQSKRQLVGGDQTRPAFMAGLSVEY